MNCNHAASWGYQVAGHPTTLLQVFMQARLLAEDPNAAERILSEHPAILHEAPQSWGTDLEELKAAFESSRNHWMNDDQDAWLATVTPYRDIVSTLKYTEVSAGARPCLAP